MWWFAQRRETAASSHRLGRECVECAAEESAGKRVKASGIKNSGLARSIRIMASAALCVQGQGASPVFSSGLFLRWEQHLMSGFAPTAGRAPSTLRIRAATQSRGPGPGTKMKLTVLQVGDKSAKVRDKVTAEPAAVKLLSRVEQVRLLSKLEKAGLLSAAESAGLSLSSIEKLGLLSKAEEFGALSAATDPKTPSLLLVAALSLLVLGPAFVFFVPETSTALVVVQVIVALISVLGGSAAFAASSFVSVLQSSD